MKPTFSAGSWNRDGTSTGLSPASSERSAVRDARLADRTEAYVAAASTSVPAAVASAEIVAQSATHGYYERRPPVRLCEDHAIAAIDLTTSPNDANPHALFHELRALAPVHWSDVHRAWLAVSHEAVNAGLRDPWLSSERIPSFERVAAQRPPAFTNVVDLLRGWMVFHDPPTHDRLRDPVRRVFTPMRLERLAPMIEATVDELLDRAADAGTGDLRPLLTTPLPALVIADLLGVPRADRERFQDWSDQLAHVVFSAEVAGTDSEVAIGAAEHFTSYFGDLIDERRRRPGDDVISALVEASDAGGPSAQELVGACTLLLFAGHETTSGLLANGTCVLLEQEVARAQLLDDPSRWPVAVDELLRFEGPAKLMARKATADRAWFGAEVRARDTVFLVILAANRDPDVFAGPDTFDVTRDPNPHFGFGWGLHHCLGAALARLEARITLRRLFERFPKLQLTDSVRWGGGVIGRTVWSVPVSMR
jgi:cytochrome P450